MRLGRGGGGGGGRANSPNFRKAVNSRPTTLIRVYSKVRPKTSGWKMGVGLVLCLYGDVGPISHSSGRKIGTGYEVIYDGL